MLCVEYEMHRDLSFKSKLFFSVVSNLYFNKVLGIEFQLKKSKAHRNKF